MARGKQERHLDSFPEKARQRRGAVLVSVLVCLLVVTMLLGLLVQSILARQRQMRAERQRAQAEWLAESALERGAALLRKDAAFESLSWQAPVQDLEGNKAGRAEIRVERVEGSPRRRKLIVEAVYPDEPQNRAFITREAFVDLPSTGDSP